MYVVCVKMMSEEFDLATLEQKKMILGQLIDHITLGKDYQVNVTLNMTYQDFCEKWKNTIIGLSVA